MGKRDKIVCNPDCVKSLRPLKGGMLSQFDKKMIYFAGKSYGRRAKSLKGGGDSHKKNLLLQTEGS
ncbi:hypothetical protein [Bartonella tribocorum]|uniref:Uncharacterized protein n=1 Tax=Bartonella tribocorum TaxID=85701 RepID=A0A2M6USJ2_9HYPH|nr:hypothetical protein [Bartonella tribocorum]PIT69152.1 hypothetical protein CEV08_06650 [Bartonella tribocorum]